MQFIMNHFRFMSLIILIQFPLATHFATTDLDSVTSKDTEHSRHIYQGENCGNRQTANNGDTQRTPHLSSHSVTYCHRHHTQNSCQGSHQHRTKTTSSGNDSRAYQTHSPFTHQLRVVNKHNTILYYNTYQHDTSQYRHHIKMCTSKGQNHNDTAECKRYGEHDNKRIGK